MNRRVVSLVNQGLTYLDPIYRDTTSIILDNNDFRDLRCLEFLHELQQLSIANNRICEMQSLSALNNLTILNLAYNDITFIDGLCSLSRLTWLNLSGNRIQRIDGLCKNLSLKHLDLSENKISQLGDLSTLRKLKTLLLHCNDISSLDTASHYLPSQLCILSLAENQLNSYTQLAYLAHLEFLIQFSIQGNPCAFNAQMNHRAYVLSWFPGLQILDGAEPTQQERRLGEWLWNSGASQSFGPMDDDRLSNYLQELDMQSYDDRSRPSCVPPCDPHHAWENQDVQVSGHNEQSYDSTHEQWLLQTQKPSIKARNTACSRVGMTPENGINRVMHAADGNSVCPERQQAFREQSKIPIHASSNSPPQYHRVFGSSSLTTSGSSLSFGQFFQTGEAKTVTTSASYQQPVLSQLPPVASDRRGPLAAPLPTARQSCLLQSDSVFIPLRESTNSPSPGSPQLQPSARKTALAQRSASCALVDCCVSPVLIPASAGSDPATGTAGGLLPNMSSSQVVLDDSLSGSDSEDEGAETKTVTYCHRASSASMQTALDVTNRRTSDTSDFPLASTSTSVLSLNRNGLSSQHHSTNSLTGTPCCPTSHLHNRVSEPAYRQEISQNTRAKGQVPAAGDCVRAGAGSNGISQPKNVNDLAKIATPTEGTPQSQENTASPRASCPVCGCCPDELHKSIALLRSQMEALREAVVVETKARQLNAQAMQFLLREVEALKEWKSTVVSSGCLSEQPPPPPSSHSHWTPHNGTGDPPTNHVSDRTPPNASTPPLPSPPPPPPLEQPTEKPPTSTASFSVIGPCKSEGSPSISDLLALNSHLAGFTSCHPASSASLAEVSPLLRGTETTTATFGADDGLRVSEVDDRENEAACLSPPTPTGTGSSPALRNSADSLDLVLPREERQVGKQEAEDEEASQSTSVASKAARFGLMVRMGGAKSDSSLRQKLLLAAGSPASSVRAPAMADAGSDLQRVRLVAIETVNNNTSASLQTDTETSLDFHGP
uniref:Centrosomal protein of n=2 Tax=Schistocephalus solidus TaxID=70667 RepID=A0A0X3NP64_SCHSO